MRHYVNTEHKIMVGEDYRSVIEETWSLSGKMLAKYCLSDLDNMMGMDPDQYKDLKELYELSNNLKEVSTNMADQLDQQTLLLFEQKDVMKELLKEIKTLKEQTRSLKDELRSLKVSQAKKELAIK